MISIRSGHHRFQLRAGAIVLDHEHVLLHRVEGDNFRALPGGRVNAGEEGRQALAREFVEELSLVVECGALVCVGENFFELGGEQYHEVGLYFAVTLPAAAAVNDKTAKHFGIEGRKRLEFKWFHLSQLSMIDFRPAALREGLRSGSVPAHFVQRDSGAEAKPA